MSPPKIHVAKALALILFVCAPALAVEPAKPVADAAGAEEADVQKIKEKYWTRGNEAEVGVVQNRVFTKRKKIELGADLGTHYGDPFLSTKMLNVNAGYYFDELRSVHIAFGKAFVGNSSALDTLQRQIGTTANTNQPKWYLVGEAHASLLYGKVSLLGSKILYFDTYFAAGGGLMATESGNNLLLQGGFGELLHITRTIGINIAYKIMWYRETVLGKVSGVNGNLGQNLGTRSNLSSMMMVGLSFLLDPMPEKPTTPAAPPAT